MIKKNRNLIVAAAVATILQGCNSSSKDSTPMVPVTPALPPPLVATETLDLDFTLPLSTQGISLDILAGATFIEDVGEFLFLGEDGLLVGLSPEGNVTAERQLDIEGVGKFSGIEYIDSDSFVVSSDDSNLYIVDQETLAADLLTNLDFSVGGVAYDSRTGTAVAIDDRSPSKIVFIAMDGATTEIDLTASLPLGGVEGVTIVDDTLVFAVVSNENNEKKTLIATSNLQGEVGLTWSIDAEQTTGLVILDPGSPEILTTNSDDQQTITLFEAPTPPSVPSEDPLQLLSAHDLDFDQPSGIDLAEDTSELWYVTDFGEVRKGAFDGANELLFEIDVMQGSFESIVAFEDRVSLMMSDDSGEDNFVTTLGFDGSLISQFEVPVVDEEHQFESLDYDDQNGFFVTITAGEGTKAIYQFNENELIRTIELPSDYDDFIVSGLSVSAETGSLFFTTEEWEDENEVLNAGVLVELDYSTFEEKMRFSIVTEEDGNLVGVKDPSDVTFDRVNNQIFVTSDVDDSILYIYQGF